MAARTDWTGVKTQVTLEQISWRLEPSTWVRSRNSVVPVRLQKWRVVGDGRTTKEQIRDYASRCQDFATAYQTSSRSVEEGDDDNTVASTTSLPAKELHPPSSPVPTSRRVEEEAYWEDRGQSSSVTHSMVEEEEMLARSPPDRGAAPSSGSEFTNADGYISGKEEDSESDKDELEEDSVELTIKEAHDFKIFQPDDEEKREPASILDLDFDAKKGQVGSAMLHIVGSCSSDSSGLFMRTIDSWSLKRDGERKLGLYVRDASKGLWIKLLRPFKEYEVSVRGARLIAKFLELAMTSKETDAKECLDKLEKIWSRDDIKTVLLKFYPSVVEKVVQSTEGPKVVRMTAIVKDMESLLMEKLEKEQAVVSVKRPSSSIETKSENKRRRIEELDPGKTPGIEEAQKESKNTTSTIPVSNKRKRVVESDSEDESGSEDHVPLAQRQFQFSGRSQTNDSVLRDEVAESIGRRNEPDTKKASRKHDQDGGASAGLRLSPGLKKTDASPRSVYTNICNQGHDQDAGASAGLRLSPALKKTDASPSWDEVGINQEGQQEYQDIADAYGGQSDGLGEIVDDDDEDLGDSAFCAICDDGGDLLLCDGPCMRSFHATEESAAKSESSRCRSLRYDPDEVRGMGSWKCLNCVHGQHQCFICGQLGRSEGDDKEVYICDVALCGRFYHPGCLAKWKKEEKFNTITDEDAFIRGVKAGVGEFCCPAHKCRRCGEGEEEGGDDNSMKLAKCRRCPKAYHKVCLPKSISFENEPIRAWEIGDDEDPMKLLVMYCLTHEIVEALSTPKRNHLKWPKIASSPEKVKHEDSQKRMGHLTQPTKKQRKSPIKITTKPIPVHGGDDEVSHGNYFKGAKLSSKRKVKLNTDLDFSATDLVRDRSTCQMPKRDVPVLASTPLAPPPRHVNLPRKNDLQSKSVAVRSVAKSFPTSTEGRKDRVLEIMRRAAQKITLETVKENLAQPSCYGENRKKNFLHLGELQSMLNAIKKAAEKVKNGGSCEDAKRLCPKDYFLRFLKNEDMLKVHLAPILHGMRYTSFGRHFTCIDKLKEIVNRIHPYVESGDMIVDFCCGANDFSILLNEKLLSTGKTCQFKNFDIHPPKNDFCFTKGDWLLNQGHGFLEGKKLIMGLNPPFGVRAALANRFIIHALKFKPKLLVLIVPPETMSYSADYNGFGYDLVWEDKELLKGHAFYLPGSVDETDGENKTQWNVVPPPLYLWSSKDMTLKHRDVAVRHKHVESLTEDPLVVPSVVASRRTPTGTPSARAVPTLTIPSDKWTNSGSTPTEGDTSSSRLQHSATSSLADGHSQNSLEGSGHCASAGGHHAAVQDSPLGRSTSGEKAADPIAHQQTALMRQGFGRGSLGHTAGPGAGPPPLPALPHPHVIQNSSSAALSSHSGPPYSTFHRSVTMSASELISKHGNVNLTKSSSERIVKHGDGSMNLSSPRENQAQRGHVERPSLYYLENNMSRNGLDSIERQQPVPQFPHRHPLMEPHRPQSLHGIQAPWLGLPPGPNPSFNQGFLPRLPNQMWPPHPMPPPPYLSPGIGPGLRPSFPPTQDPYFVGRPGPLERRPGPHHHDFHKESGGWLE